MSRRQRKSPPPDGGRPACRQAGRVGGEEPDGAVVLLRRARRLRMEPTEAERAVWARLRKRQLLGHKFRRQRPIGRYIVDFVCLERLLVVELDGSQHLEQQNYDEARRLFLEGEGYRVLRFWNNEALAQTDSVIETIAEALGECRAQ